MGDERDESIVAGRALPMMRATDPRSSAPAAQRAYGPGVSCWTELRSTDVAGAVAFYAQLFGWTARRVEVRPDEPYTVMQQGAIPRAGVCARTVTGSQDEAAVAGAHWRVYTTVSMRPASVDLGTRKPPIVPRDGRLEHAASWSFARKPLGALYAASRAPKVPAEDGAPGAPAVIWMDLNDDALPESAVFWRAFLEDAESDPSEDPMRDPMRGESALVLANDEPGAPASGVTLLGGNDAVSGLPPWSVGFAVVDCEQTIRRALALGARLAAPAETLAGLGTAAALVDPQGATFVCWQPQQGAVIGRGMTSRAPAGASPPELAAAGRAAVLAKSASPAARRLMRGPRSGDA